jgi:hypothetical protein
MFFHCFGHRETATGQAADRHRRKDEVTNHVCSTN